MPTILVVDDDPHIRDVVVFALEKQGYSTMQASNGAEALQVFARHQPDLLILDVMMPEMDGTELCKAIRKTSSVPIIFLTAMNDEVDQIIGLEVGGDDYVFKPFSPRLLLARVKAVFRRAGSKEADLSQPSQDARNARIQQGALVIDTEQCRVFWNDHELVLTVTETGLLEALASRPGKVFSREELMQRAYDNIVVSDRTIDSHIRRIRAKFNALGADPIETVHGIGYKMSVR